MVPPLSNDPFFQLEWPYHCERRCQSIPTDPSRNVIFLSGDRMVSASCDAAFRNDGDDYSRRPVWSDPGRTSPSVLMASCTDFDADPVSGTIVGRDCVNGTLMPRRLLPPHSANYTLIHRIFYESGLRHALRVPDGETQMMPFESEIVIYNRTRLLINTEACVNTLQHECTQFYLDHRRDGRNYSANDRFPCHYTPNHDEFVTTR